MSAEELYGLRNRYNSDYNFDYYNPAKSNIYPLFPKNRISTTNVVDITKRIQKLNNLNKERNKNLNSQLSMYGTILGGVTLLVVSIMSLKSKFSSKDTDSDFYTKDKPYFTETDEKSKIKNKI